MKKRKKKESPRLKQLRCYHPGPVYESDAVIIGVLPPADHELLHGVVVVIVVPREVRQVTPLSCGGDVELHGSAGVLSFTTGDDQRCVIVSVLLF